MILAVTLVVASFATMELVSYASHRWLMHGPGMAWHRSHHLPPAGPVEKNDLFPLCFSLVGAAIFAAALIDALTPLRWVGLGVTLYGAAYLFVHDVVIHARLRLPLPQAAYLDWLRRSHRIHHLFGGEPYGMLVPWVPRSLRRRAASLERDSLTRSSPARSTRVTRSRL